MEMPEATRQTLKTMANLFPPEHEALAIVLGKFMYQAGAMDASLEMAKIGIKEPINAGK